ncbi:MAG: hemerythrin domain-containing protein [Sandaracinaceae bacterium]
MTTSSLRQHFMEDHQRLEAAMDRLMDAAEGATSDVVVEAWRELEAGLQAHLRAEEESMFPLVRDEALLAEMRTEHERIRRDLDELGLEVELHTIRRDKVDEFLERLRTHSAHEETTLYRLADEAMDEPSRRTLLERLRDMVQERLRQLQQD